MCNGLGDAQVKCMSMSNAPGIWRVRCAEPGTLSYALSTLKPTLQRPRDQQPHWTGGSCVVSTELPNQPVMEHLGQVSTGKVVPGPLFTTIMGRAQRGRLSPRAQKEARHPHLKALDTSFIQLLNLGS